MRILFCDTVPLNAKTGIKQSERGVEDISVRNRRYKEDVAHQERQVDSVGVKLYSPVPNK